MLKLLLAAIFSSAILLVAQTGGIRGIVLSPTGKPLPRADLYYGRLAPARPKAAAAVLPPLLIAKGALDGSFTLSKLVPGTYAVCPEASGYLNPCHWSTAPSFAVAAGQVTQNATIRLATAYALHIQVNDPHALLLNEGKLPGAFLQLGARSPSGALHLATMAANTPAHGNSPASRDYVVAIPLDTPVSVFVSGGAFQLNDASGASVPGNGKQTQVTVPSSSRGGQPNIPPLVFTVAGLIRH